jgi:hypothetical protein
MIMGVLFHNQPQYSFYVSDAIGVPHIWTQTEFFKRKKLTMITISFVPGVILSIVCQVSQYCPMNLSHLITQSKEE